MKSFGKKNLLLHAIFKFGTTKCLFKYFRQRYSDQQLKCLNKLNKTRGRIRTLLSKTAFLKANISQRTLPKSVRFRVEKSRVTVSPNIERAFMHDEIKKNQSMAAFLRTKCRSLWQEARQFLSFFDLVQFCRYLSVIDEQKEAVNQKKNSNNLRLLFQHRFGNQTIFKQNNIVNLSDYKLSDTERFVLSHGLSFCLPPTSVKREEILADFEVLYAQLVYHKPRSEEQLAALKARLSDLAHAYCGSSINLGDFLMTRVFSGHQVPSDE